jgi:hypothetical protein
MPKPILVSLFGALQVENECRTDEKRLSSSYQHRHFRCFAAQQFNTAYDSSCVGRYDRTSHTRDVPVHFSATTRERERM